MSQGNAPLGEAVTLKEMIALSSTCNGSLTKSLATDTGCLHFPEPFPRAFFAGMLTTE